MTALPPILAVPLLAREKEPTQTDFRAVMRWTDQFEAWFEANSGSVPALEARVTALEASVATLQTSVSDLATDIGTLTTDVTTIQGQITTIQSQITTLQGQVTTLQGQVSTLTTNVTTLQGQVTTLQGQVSTLQSQVATLITQMAALPNVILGHVNVGTLPTAGTKLTLRVDSFVATPSGGIVTTALSGFSTGFNVIVTPGDNSGGLATCVPVLGSSSLTTLAVAVYAPGGSVVTAACRVNYQLLGA